MTPKYAIQGFQGCFHQEAAQLYFNNNIQFVFCATFKQTFAEGQKKENSGSIIAIENSIAGSILPNYTLLRKSKLKITGEIYLPIKQHLLANQNITLNDIKQVMSHPMALLQCHNFLEKYNFKLVETEDTALSAKFIKQHHCKHIAAVAGKLAAQLFNLQILVPNIHSEKNNITRFLILEKEQNIATKECNKTSIYFETNHTTGALANVLTMIANQKCNLSKLQSFPIPGSNFQYYFYADIEFENYVFFEKMIAQLNRHQIQHKILGMYKKGEII